MGDGGQVQQGRDEERDAEASSNCVRPAAGLGAACHAAQHSRRRAFGRCAGEFAPVRAAAPRASMAGNWFDLCRGATKRALA